LAYGEVPTGDPLSIIGSSEFLEVAVNQGNAAQELNVETGDPVRVKVSR